MKTICTLIIACISLTAFSQRTVTKNVGDFDTLKVFDLIEVTLVQSDENKVVIKGENKDDVKLLNLNGKLKIRMRLDERFNGENTFVEVHYTSVDELDANEGAYIVSRDPIKQNTIELRAQEGGRINLDLEVNHLKVKAVTGGSIQAAGTAGSQEISLTTGGIFQGKELETEDTKVKITAAGEADVNASGTVDINITAGGDVYVYGNPEEIKKKRLAGGRIKVIN